MAEIKDLDRMLHNTGKGSKGKVWEGVPLRVLIEGRGSPVLVCDICNYGINKGYKIKQLEHKGDYFKILFVREV